MKRLLETIIVLTVWLVSASLAEAITITVAEVQNGLAVVAGNKAPKNVAITWETDSRGLTTKSGSFNFSSSVVPADCVGELNIVGADTINVGLANCTPVSGVGAPVPQTGQTLCYNSIGEIIDCFGTGQDGELQNGVKLPTPRLTDNGNGTITDNLTGLIWLKNANCLGHGPWQQALSLAGNLATGQCGLTDDSNEGDWRVPNIREILSLFDYSQSFPALPSGHPFLNVQSAPYWSSTTKANETTHALSAIFDRGWIFADGKESDTGDYVLPVRGP